MVHARRFFYDAAECPVSSLERTMTLLAIPALLQATRCRHSREKDRGGEQLLLLQGPDL